MTIRILIVDHETLCREGLMILMRTERGMSAAGAIGSLAELDTFDSCVAVDVVLINVDIPKSNISQSANALRKRFEGVRIVAIGGPVTDMCVSQVLAADVDGLVRRVDGFATIREAIHAVHAGQRFYVREARDRIVAARSGDNGCTNEETTRLHLLTPRELQLLRLIATGHSLRAACESLNVSYKTGDKHKVNLMRKLAIHDRVELARYAIREGLISP